MASSETVKINLAGGLRQASVMLKAVGVRRFCVRLWLGRKVLWLAASILGCGFTIDDDTRKAREV